MMVYSQQLHQFMIKVVVELSTLSDVSILHRPILMNTVFFYLL